MFEGTIVSGRGAPRCCQPVGRPFSFRPVHAWLVRRWPACVWSVYGQVVAAAVVWLVRGCRGRLVVCRVCVGSVALLSVVLSSNPARLASTFVSASVCGVLVCTSVVKCSLGTFVGRVRSGRVAVFLCACGHCGSGARLATVSLARWSSLSHRPMPARPAWRWSVRARSAHGHGASAVVVLAVCGRVSRLLVGLFGVRSLLSQQALAQSDLLCAGVPLVAMLVGARCVGPAQYVCTVRRPPAAGLKSHDKWSDSCKKKRISPCRCPVPCPALAVLHAQSIIRYFAVLRSRTSSFACATHMYTPRRWQGPAGPPRCVPVLPMGAPGRCSSSVVLCSCSCLSVCRAPFCVVRCGSFGWRVCVMVPGVVARMVRVVRLVLWCRDALSDVAFWARRNTPVPVGRGVGAAPCGELVAPRMPRVGLWRTGVPGSVAAPPPSHGRC